MLPRSLFPLRFSVSALALISACSGYQPDTVSPPPPVGAQTQEPVAATAPPPASAEEAAKFIADVNEGLRKSYVEKARAEWIQETNITPDTDALAEQARDATMAYVTAKIKESVRFRDVPGLSKDVARQLELLRRGTDLPAPNDDKERRELASLATAMGSTYGTGKYCSKSLAKFAKKKADAPKVAAAAPTQEVCLTLGELSHVLEDPKSSYEEKLEAWKGWRTISVPMRDQYQRFVELGNKGAKDIGFSDLGELWRARYDMTPAELETDVERLWQQVKPLYNDLHCYVRGELQKKYGSDKIPDKGTIPAHLLGNMWSQTWGNIYPEVAPHKGEPSLDVTKGLLKKKMKPLDMMKTGESFFTSLGMKSLPKTFWERSMIEQPPGREVVCHASAWDLTFAGDVRVKMCTEVNEEDLITIHHELGHNYYFLYYNEQPILFQEGANDGFHEGIGDTLALSVTPEYLVKIGLLDRAPGNDKAELNVLMRRALDKVAFLPFGLLIDKWRWDVFSGKTKSTQYNQAWWDLVQKYQGVSAPVARSESDFDPGAKFHVPANVPYLRYFLADIYQFQFHRALCKATGHTGPLHKCSIHGNTAAGDKLKAMLALGASQPWPEAMKAISGESKADASAILEYFAPLSAYLKEQNKGRQCGW